MKENKFVVPGSKKAIENMKYEIASELGVNMGPDATSRAPGTANLFIEFFIRFHLPYTNIM